MNAEALTSVRLACVRHAASVRPEPGSNSQKVVSKACFQTSNQSFEQFASSKITQEFSLAVYSIYIEILNKSINLSKVLFVRLHVIQFTRYSEVFSLRSRSLELLYSITTDSVCQELFSDFFKIFLNVLFAWFFTPKGS